MELSDVKLERDQLRRRVEYLEQIEQRREVTREALDALVDAARQMEGEFQRSWNADDLSAAKFRLDKAREDVYASGNWKPDEEESHGTAGR